MKHRNAQRLASLILDEWPVPRFIKRWIESHPDVAAELQTARHLESELRSDSTARQLECLVSRTTNVDHRSRYRWAVTFLATAAAVLIAVGAWRWQRNRVISELAVQQQVENLKPVLASVSAGQTVAESVSAGTQRLLARFTHAAHRFATPEMDAHGGDTPSTLDENSTSAIGSPRQSGRE